MRMMKNSINHKLAAGFGLCVLLTGAMVVFNFSALQRLDTLYQDTLKRSVDMELATDAQHIGEAMYMIIANSVINRNMTKSEQEWAAGKRDNLAKLQKMAIAADTPEEHALVREARAAFDDIIRIYEKEMLPLIRQGATVPGPLADIDARIDAKIDAIDLAMEWIARTTSDENQHVSREFHAVLGNTIRLALTISLIGVGAALFISVLTTRRIVHPLKELTWAAEEIEKGNYHVKLNRQSADEIGMLVDTFRGMSAEVGKRTAELQAANERLQSEIGERKLAEEEIQNLNVELEQRVATRTAELLVANNQCRQVISVQKQVEGELRSSHEELRNLSQHLQAVREEERTAIAREIHDELGQLLTALKMEVSWLGGKLPEEQRQLVKKTREIAIQIDETIKTVQRISAELRPGILDDLGLTAAIEWQCQEFQKKTGIICEFQNSFECGALDRSRSTALFRIFQETLTNIYRHAEATRAGVTLEKRGDDLVATVTDNGKGITEKRIFDSKSFGLIGIRERVRYFGGEVCFSRIPDGGTSVRVIIPLDSRAKERPDDNNTHSG
jgi:signal transduction histidine kinase